MVMIKLMLHSLIKIVLIDMEVETKSKDLQTAEIPKMISHRIENISINPSFSKENMDATVWRFNEILGVKRHIVTVDIDPTLAVGDLIYSFVNTPRNVLNLFDASNLASYFAYFRYNVVFNFELQSTFQQVGALVVNQLNVDRNSPMLPWTGIVASALSLSSQSVSTILPHDFITLGHNGFYKITMPWNCSRNMLPSGASATEVTNSRGLLHDYDLGALYVSIFSPMLVASSVYSTASLRILAHLENIEYSGFRPGFTI